MTNIENTSEKYSVFDKILLLFNRICNVERFKYCAIYTTVFMLMAHAFFYLNIQYRHDGLGNVYDQSSAMYIATGRWGTPLFKFLIEGLEGNPWKVGIITICFMIIVSYLISDLFDFSKGQSFTAIVFLTTNLTMISQYNSYIGYCGVYSAATFFAVIGVYIFEKSKINIFIRMLISALCLMCSMSMYPAYLAVSAGLFIMTLLTKEDSDVRSYIKEEIIKGVQDIIVLAIGVIFYFISMNIAYAVTGIGKWESYNSPFKITELGVMDIISSIPGLYSYIFRYFFESSGYVDGQLMFCNVGILLITLISVGLMLLSKLSYRKKVLAIIFLIILPMGVNGFYLVSGGVLHYLMIYSFNLLYLVPLLLLSSKSLNGNPYNSFGISIKSTLRRVLLLSFGVMSVIVLWHNTVYANGAYLYSKLMYDSTARDVSLVWNDIESIKEYDSGVTPVIVVGRFDNSEMDFDSPEGDKYIKVLPGVDDSSITYSGTFGAFSRYLEGKYNDIIIENDPAYIENERVIEMPSYPLEGSVCWMDNAVFVKLSNDIGE